MIFIDSSFILGLFNDKDDNHPKIIKLLKFMPEIINEKKAINNIILTEVLNKIHKNYYRNVRTEIINFLLNIDKIYYLENDQYLNAIKLMETYKYTMNYSDCLILLTMEKNNINTIISFDNNFDKIKGIKRIYV